MSKWSEFYKGRMNERYEKHIRKKYHTFIDTIVKQIRWYNSEGKVPTVAELGCGIGSITKVLCSIPDIEAQYIMLDNDSEILDMAQKHNLIRVQRHHSIHYFDRDIRNTTHQGIDIVHSHGVLEHMCDEDIKRVISNWPNQKHFHFVPSHKYEKPSFGDERLMDSKTWETITKAWVVEFNDGYDYMLIR